MSANRNAKQLLDELMGTQRNAPKHRRNQIDWRDDNICPYYLCGWCPFRGFARSKACIGQCYKQHNEVAKTIFQRSSWEKQFDTYVKYREALNLVKRELEFRTRRSKDKLLQMLQNQEGSTAAPTPQIGRREMDAIKEIGDKITALRRAGNENPEKRSKYESQIVVLDTVLDGLQKKLSKINNINDPSRYLLCETCGGLISNINSKGGGNELQMHAEGIIHMETIKYHSEIKRVDKLFAENENISKLDKIETFSDDSRTSRSTSRSSRSRSYSSYSRSSRSRSYSRSPRRSRR